MLDYCGYSGSGIRGKHVIDNSCGDGAFLVQVARRYCEEALKAGIGKDALREELATFIHGIDIDADVCARCRASLDDVTQAYDVLPVDWDMKCQNALLVREYDGKMDFVVGNPPYVRVHNLDDSYGEVKSCKFCGGGMTDLYLAFFEIGFDMLSGSGRLCYITPSSWLNSVAAHDMRKYIIKEQNLESLVDLGHYQPFENATAYTIISLFQRGRKSPRFDYYTFDTEAMTRRFHGELTLECCFIDSCFYLSDRVHLEELREIKSGKHPKYVSVKNGFATLADGVFIGNGVPRSKITINVVKASTGKWYPCLFPYDKRGKLLPPDVVFSEPEVQDHFKSHKEELLKGRAEYAAYYEYGRTQALNDVWREKVAINTLIRSEKDLKIERVKAGEGVYSGLYVTSERGITVDEIRSVLATPDFVRYVRLLKKYKSGGYYTFNTKDVQQYINFKLDAKQQTIFGRNF